MKKNLLGFFSFLPIFLVFVLMLLFPFLAFGALTPEGEELALLATIPLFLLITASSVVLTIFYVLHALSNQKIQGQEKVLWILFIVSVNIISIPVYFYHFIWKNRG